MSSYKKSWKRKLILIRAAITNQNENLDKIFEFLQYTKQTIARLVETELQRFLKVLSIKSFNGKLIHSLSTFKMMRRKIFQFDTNKTNTALTLSTAVERVFSLEKDMLIPFYAVFDQRYFARGTKMLPLSES